MSPSCSESVFKMTAVILTVHVLIVLALIGVVLLQRSDGGALGLGGGSGGGFMTGRGAANALTRTTSLLAAAFFATSLILAIRAGTGEDAESVIDELTGQDAQTTQEPFGEPTTDDLLNRLGGGESGVVSEEAILDALGADDALPLPEGEAAPSDDPDAGSGEEGGEVQSDPETTP